MQYGIISITDTVSGKHADIYADSTDNNALDETISIPEDIVVDTVNLDRTFPIDACSTVAMPFAVNTANLTGVGAICEYNGIVSNELKFKVVYATHDYAVAHNFSKTDYTHVNLTAYKPYAFYMTETKLNITGPVTFSQTRTANIAKNGWMMMSSLHRILWLLDDLTTGYAYGFAASKAPEHDIEVGNLVKIGNGAYIKPLRAYLVQVKSTKKSAEYNTHAKAMNN